LKLHTKIKSSIDDSVKYIFFTETDKLAVESTFINKHDNKHIICLPTQTSCCMKCRFCHITDITDKIILRNLKIEEIVGMVSYIFNDLQLSYDKTLLVSFMGCGEPLLNVKNLLGSMIVLNKDYKKIRFAIATSIPKNNDKNFNYFIDCVKKNALNVKLHFSLHYTNDDLRRKWMPGTEYIQNSLEKVKEYKDKTGNDVEIHYTLIDGINDTEKDIDFLIGKFKGTDICIKFIRFNTKNSIDSTETPIKKVSEIMSVLKRNNIKTEYYIPPARDIGGSCGQILTEEYLKFNRKQNYSFSNIGGMFSGKRNTTYC